MKAKFKNLLESNYIIPIVAVVATNFNELKYLDGSDVDITCKFSKIEGTKRLNSVRLTKQSFGI
jgi:hypothetical protein